MFFPFKRTFFTLLLLFGLLQNASTKGTFDLTNNIENAYQKIIELRLDEAETLLKAEERVRPDNLMTDFMQNYIDCIKVFVNEDYALFEQLEPKKYQRLERIGNGDKSSPYYLYTQAAIRLNWMTVRSKFGESLTALRELRKALGLLEDNQKKFPAFMPNLQGLGTIHITVGAVPEDYKWTTNLLGLSGSIEQGFQELQTVINHAQKNNDYIFGQETVLMTSYLLLQLGSDAEKAWKIIQNPLVQPAKSPLAAYVKALVAYHSKHNTEAINILQSHKPKGNQFNIPQWDFLLGSAKLNRLDSDANIYLERFVKGFKGRHYIKRGYEKLAYHGLIFKGKPHYIRYAELCQQKGYSEIDTDKQAAKNMAGSIPNEELLKADLLFNGGLHQKSLSILNQINTASLSDSREKIQVSYLKARNYQSLKQFTKAIQSYKETIDLGKNHPSYYACNAALQIGLIYENKKLNANAKQYFKLCLSIQPEEYKTSLHIQAKAGMNRIK